MGDDRKKAGTERRQGRAGELAAPARSSARSGRSVGTGDVDEIEKAGLTTSPLAKMYVEDVRIQVRARCQRLHRHREHQEIW